MSFWKTASADLVKRYDSDASAIPMASASALVQKSGILTSQGPLHVLDNACGTGIVSQCLVDALPDATRADICLVMADISQSMIDAARVKAEKGGWKDASLRVLDMQNMQVFANETFDFVFVNQGVQFAPDAGLVVKELHRVLKKTGILAIATWRSIGWASTLRQAIASIEGCPAFPSDDDLITKLQQGNSWEDEAFIRDQLLKHGFAKVEIDVSVAKHPFGRATFANTFGGPMLKGLLQPFWTEEELDAYFAKIVPAVAGMLERNGTDGVVVEMEAIIVVARKV